MFATVWLAFSVMFAAVWLAFSVMFATVWFTWGGSVGFSVTVGVVTGFTSGVCWVHPAISIVEKTSSTIRNRVVFFIQESPYEYNQLV